MTASTMVQFSSSCARNAAGSPRSTARTASGYVAAPRAAAITVSVFCDSANAAV